MDLGDRINLLFFWLRANRERIGWVMLAGVLTGVVALVNPAKLLVGTWLGAKIIASALIGVALFRTWDDPRADELEGIERAMAYTRRVTLMAAAIVAAAFAP